MQLFVHTEDLHALEVTGQEMITKIKAHVASLKGITPDDHAILLAGQPLEDETTPGQCGVEALATLEVAGCMLGGEVHGSLAWGEKVRSQIPKEEKEEEEEDMTGWAKQQMHYNRYFINVMPIFGKKKGPNANS
ncbi:ubiquitin-like protein FUBI [Octodon degus]|uniref:Ubiquitin-like protein FUBI n=1 Tax=Octodon degus TaxID=10160 RepID=A0A6P3FXK0_OCTDE|nr:ubiquitin-like protein FUBI [Octodon degus]